MTPIISYKSFEHHNFSFTINQIMNFFQPKIFQRWPSISVITAICQYPDRSIFLFLQVVPFARTTISPYRTAVSKMWLNNTCI